MKNLSVKKLALAGMFCALCVVGSVFSFPMFGSKCAPVQHMVNVLCAVLLGPWWGVGVAFVASLLRNLLGLGSLMAFPGSMFGALLCGLVYHKTKNILATLAGEVFGTMGDVLAEGGAWVPGRAITPYHPERSAGEVVLRTDDLSFGREFPLGKHIDLEFHAGEVTALTGRNGVGKSTLALTLAGLLEPLAGHVRMAERMVPPRRANDVSTWKSRDLLGRVGMVFQEPEHQFVTASVRDEVAVGPKSMGKTDEEAYRIADEILERMNLKRFGPANPFTLSGGEKRRLSVASMMAAAPKVVVMDEPTFGQDFTTWTEMVRLIADVRDAGSAVIMVTHDEALIEALDARRIVVSEEEQHD